MSVWLLSAVCLTLVAALSWALGRLYRLQAEGGPRPAAQGPGAGSVPAERIEELTVMLLALHEYGATKTGNVSQNEFCSLFLEDACRLVGSERGTVMLYDEDSDLLSVVAAKNPNGRTPLKLKLRPGEGVAGRAFQSERPLVVLEPRRDPRYLRGPGQGPDEPFLSIPIRLPGKAIGVLNLHDTGNAAAPNEAVLKMLCLLAGEAASVLHHQRRLDDLQSFYLEMVQALAATVNAKDSYSQEQVEATRRLARELAIELGLPDQMVRYVEFAMMLHSVGKIGIDQGLLSKPGKLTPEEFEQIKKHTTIGHRILAGVKFLGPVAQMVLYHQEWYNGKGYPEGLKGEEIPLGSRIVAVVNAWQAMNSDRPYRKRLGRDQAVSELKRCAGDQFDPKVVEAFLRVERRNNNSGQASRAAQT